MTRHLPCALPSLSVTSKSPFGDRDQTSPELILVSDPDAAQRAREDLPPSRGRSPETVARPANHAAARRVEPPPYPRIEVEEPVATPETRGSRGRRRLVAVTLVLLAAAAAALGWYAWGRPDSGSSPTQTTAIEAFVPARTWVWSASSGARGYLFEMMLDGRTVVHARIAQARFELPKSFRFRPGRYRWTVRRIPPAVGGKILSDSSFVLTKATAARSNP